MRPPGITITRYACRELLAQRPGLSHTDLAHGTFVTRRSMNTRPAHNGTALACYQARRPSYGRHPSHRVNRARPPTTEIGKCCRQDGRTAHARQPRCAAAKSTTSSPDQLHRFPQDVVIAVRKPNLYCDTFWLFILEPLLCRSRQRLSIHRVSWPRLDDDTTSMIEEDGSTWAEILTGGVG